MRTAKFWVKTARVCGVLAQDCSRDPSGSVHANTTREGQAVNTSPFTVTASKGGHMKLLVKWCDG